jgi:hypothetical protein
LILDFEFDQHLESHKHVINIIMGFRDMGCYTDTLCRGARSIAPGDHVSRIEILHRKVKRIKLHETPIASSEITNG